MWIWISQIRQFNYWKRIKKIWRWSRNQKLNWRNRLIKRRNRQQRSLIRNLRQKRSCLRRSQSWRRWRLQKKIRKRCLSYVSFRLNHRKIINYWCQHQRRIFSFSWIKQNRWIQPHHGLSLSSCHLLLRIFRQCC